MRKHNKFFKSIVAILVAIMMMGTLIPTFAMASDEVIEEATTSEQDRIDNTDINTVGNAFEAFIQTIRDFFQRIIDFFKDLFAIKDKTEGEEPETEETTTEEPVTEPDPEGSVPVSSVAELIEAINNNATLLALQNDIEISESLVIGADLEVTIYGKGFNLTRAEGFDGNMITCEAGSTLTMEKVTVDGGAVWEGENDPTLLRPVTNTGITTTGAVISTANNANVVLGEGCIIQNNDGAAAINLGTRIGATLTLNGGEIINNNSSAGAIWGGGHITINSGKINSNSSTGIAGAIRMVSNCNLTINGGELNHNKSVGDGGVIWGYGSSTYTFTGGEMAYNESQGTGGAIYTGTYSVINISGEFELHDNKAANSGAIRLTDHTSMTMTGGKVYNNTQNGESNAFNTWNNSISLTGGSIADDFSFVGGLGLTIGKADISGVIAYDLSTNHNTAYLAEDFNGFVFTVDKTNTNFSNFNFKPAAGYVYTEGDEAKFVYEDGTYEVHWDAAAGLFKLSAK